MRAVVHYIEADSGRETTEQNTFYNCKKNGWREKDKMCINPNKTYNEQNCLEVKLEVPCCLFAGLGKIIADTFLKLAVEGYGQFWKLRTRHLYNSNLMRGKVNSRRS